MKIDAHVHAGKQFTDIQIINQMDSEKIDKSVIFPFFQAGFCNDEIALYATKHTDRLIPFCAVNPLDGRSAQIELERRYKENFKGLKLHPVLCGINLSDHQFVDPLFEITLNNSGIVIAHGTSDLQNCPLEFDRIAKRFPTVPLIMAHSGVFWSCDQAIEIAMENENLFLEISRVPEFETKKILHAVGSTKVIWGTDSPYCAYSSETEKIARCTQNADDANRVMGGNLAKLLKL